ncbi:thiamine pyrophosphate-dependent enzyme [Streptomyces sp. NPDC056161]|uniref:thiamine pyrophosphate-dependent enzyme n=1 Tax=Streptomyces sp. NPDC056161 TaxID=3345732 RepID=UPI0035E04116
MGHRAGPRPGGAAGVRAVLAHGRPAAGGGLGRGLTAVVGTALADPSRAVVCLLGDGSAQYSIQALWTAARLGLRLIVIVLNNGEYAAAKSLSRTFGAHHRPSYDLPGIDIAHHPQGYGCTGRVPKDPTAWSRRPAQFPRRKPPPSSTSPSTPAQQPCTPDAPRGSRASTVRPLPVVASPRVRARVP